MTGAIASVREVKQDLNLALKGKHVETSRPCISIADTRIIYWQLGGAEDVK